ncbi:hypothetical protein [Pseudomonas indica]|uniref:hypothetical protein n=1 Tax=Pseudomonas indica TaxID=137658 RepID=UPI000A01FD75|nr:hypothetical protein [Pseudomonas indica]
MLIIRLKARWSLHLERKLGEAGKAGIWEFHRSESSYTTDGRTTFRNAALRPAEPKEGQTVEVFICSDSREPEEQWRAVGEGVARYE